VLHNAAHPDDEDSFLIARLARRDHARVAYLSINRGEGGQNVIGPELFEALGVIRSEELLQARALDGGDQLFGRVMDYGFSKRREEAGAKWSEERVLCDIVRAIRVYRPQVMVARFVGGPADGHGQHQLVGHLSPQAFDKAADPAACPSQIASGLRPWQAKKFYVSEGFMPSPDNQPTLRLATGLYAPQYGRSYFEIAAQGRSQHRSQEMGMLELRGPHVSGVRLVKSHVATPAAESHLFDGIDVTVPGLAKTAGLPAGALQAPLLAMDAAAKQALGELDADEPHKIAPYLAAGLQAARAARSALATLPGASAEARAEADFLLLREEREWQAALIHAAGIAVDALAADGLVAPGEAVPVALRAYFPGSVAVQPGSARFELAAGWSAAPATPADETDPRRRRREETPSAEAHFALTAPADARPTVPYWLEQPRQGDHFEWPADERQGQPFGPPLALAVWPMEVAGVAVEVEAAVQHRVADPARGELRRDLNVAPALAVALDTDLHVVPASAKPQTRRIAVRLTQHARAPLSGVVRLELPKGLTATPAEAPFALTGEDQRTAVAFTVTIPAGVPQGAHVVKAVATAGGASYRHGLREIAYDHIQTHRLLTEAAATVRVLDVKVAPVRVGYVMGSGDRVPDAIRRLGLDVTLLDEDFLSAGDLSRFDTIVIGVRASQVRPDFVAANGRLLDFAKAGGTLIVQYQRPDYTDRKLAPFGGLMKGPTARVTEEDAKVTLLQPEHPALSAPNRIGAADFDGWVQERSLYEFTDFGPELVPLLAAGDTGEEPGRGGYLHAKLGAGHYVYTGYAFFRQLPAGVPGAYRLFANLLSLGHAPKK
jgi:LmbE family N-acetylglucosaminyl deacetylase